MHGGGKKPRKLKTQKQSEDNIVKKEIFLDWKKENEEIKDRVIRDIKNLFEKAEEDYCNPIRVGNRYSNSYIEYESNSDRNKTPSIDEFFNKTRPPLKDIINNLKTLIHGKIKCQ